MNIKRGSFILVIFLSFAALTLGFSSLSAQSKGDIFITIAKYIQKGDSEKLSIWFADNLEIDLMGEQISCSKTQAKYILKDFFEKHPPKKYNILHKSGNPNMRYAIGKLQCASGEEFRIILLLKSLNKNQLLVRVRIEKE